MINYMADFFWGAFVVIIILVGSVVGAQIILKAIDFTKECSSNTNCSSNSYCGSDFKCHDFPQHTSGWPYFYAALVIGLASILCTMLYRKSPYEKFVRDYSNWYWSTYYPRRGRNVYK